MSWRQATFSRMASLILVTIGSDALACGVLPVNPATARTMPPV
jgi:hypothetical protein